MALRSWMTRVVQSLTSRGTLRACLVLLVVLLLMAAGLRIRTALPTRTVSAALSQLEKIRVDQTTEAQLLKALPALVKDSDRGAVRRYRMEISNWPHHEWCSTLSFLSSTGIHRKVA